MQYENKRWTEFHWKQNHFQKNEQKLQQQQQREQRQTSGNKSMHSVNEVQIDKMSCMDCGFTFIFNHIILLLCRDFYCFLRECELNFWLRFMDMKEDEINNGFEWNISFIFVLSLQYRLFILLSICHKLNNNNKNPI